MDDETLVRRAEDAADLLEAIVEDRAVMAQLDRDLRVRLMRAAGRASVPERREKKKLSRAMGVRDRNKKRVQDQQALEGTGIRTKRRAQVYLTPPPLEQAQLEAGGARPSTKVHDTRSCYVCKTDFQTVHFFYDQMCPPCAAFNWAKRHQTSDLSGRTALVTGGRVKIGYQAAMKLLRAGARVIVTTRFPVDAAQRFTAEEDYAAIEPRLAIYGLDLRHTPSVESFTAMMNEREDRLDFILNNACQTIRRPAGFYQHLMPTELNQGALPATVAERAHIPPAGELTANTFFPEGALDQDLQQIDLRKNNSWRLRLHEVDTVELFEVLLVNAVAPFVLNGKLKPLMMKHASDDKHIVNVSAMEGQFYRYFKTDKHPHTNMAKAALNMMTRTAAPDYLKAGIHMNAVDTGWVTDEDPADIAARKAEEGFVPPLDIVDGAARICDPIFSGLNDGSHLWGQFLKDYKPTNW